MVTRAWLVVLMKVKEEWRFGTTVSGTQFVMMAGT